MATLGALCRLLRLNEEEIVSETEVHTFLKVLLQMVHLQNLYNMCVYVTTVCVCSVIGWKQTQFSVE